MLHLQRQPRYPSIFVARVAVLIVLRWSGSRHAEVFVGPCAQVDHLAALAAKRTKAIAGRKQAGAAACGAFHRRVRWARGVWGSAHKREAYRKLVLRTERKLESSVFRGGLELAILIRSHEAHRHHQPITTDFRHQVHAGINPQTQ